MRIHRRVCRQVFPRTFREFSASRQIVKRPKLRAPATPQVFMMHWDALAGTWGLLISYGLSALPLSYLYSFAFDGPSAAQISIAGVNFLTGFGFVVAYAVLVRGEKH